MARPQALRAQYGWLVGRLSSFLSRPCGGPGGRPIFLQVSLQLWGKRVARRASLASSLGQSKSTRKSRGRSQLGGRHAVHSAGWQILLQVSLRLRGERGGPSCQSCRSPGASGVGLLQSCMLARVRQIDVQTSTPHSVHVGAGAEIHV